ncbi:MAG: lipoprotein insertase outer membrane protein LolB [Pseudomonadota bacterium]
MCGNGSSRPPNRAAAVRPWLAIAAALLLAACAAQRPVNLPDLSAWDTRQQVLAGLDEWGFTGRVAVRTEDDGFNAKLRYEHNHGEFSAVVSGPLGMGTVELESDAGAVRYTDKDGVESRFAAEELAWRFGWNVPLDSLRYWALGIPDPDQAAETTLNESGQLESLRQGAWTVDVGRYRDIGGQVMPARLTVSNTETRVRLVIDRWRL